MRALAEQDHYEILEVPHDAASEEIERAYHMVRETYDPESLALYSLFGERDAMVIRERIEEAYRVLRDSEARRAYDAAHVVASRRESAALDGETPAAEAIYPGAPAEARAGRRDAPAAFSDLAADVEEGQAEFDGAMLRRARLRRGIELEQVADITKVSTTNLRHLEEERFDDLPATVYVRGFVAAYAQTIGLDPRRVVTSYVARVERARVDQGRGRFLGRR